MFTTIYIWADTQGLRTLRGGGPATGGGGYSPDVSHGAYNGTIGIHQMSHTIWKSITERITVLSVFTKCLTRSGKSV